MTHACPGAGALTFFAALGLSLLALPTVALGQDPNECDEPGEAPDVIIGDLYETTRWGSVGEVTAFSVGTYSCNIGTCWALWYPDINQHPVITQNMFRLKEGRFEQIGQSWLKHGFFALSAELCTEGCIATDGHHLGVNCADPYSASLNGTQSGMGPKFEVNPHTGEFPYPATDLFVTGDDIYKRLQVHNDDLDPDLNPGAQYFVASQYVTPDDAAAGNHRNNASYRPVNVVGTDGTYDLDLMGSTRTESPAIMAWLDNDPNVQIVVLKPPDDGRFFLAATVTQVSANRWHYEYALQNVDSHRGAREFGIPMLPGANLTDVGFHDVDYHSGEPFDGTDWPWILDAAAVPGTLIWKTDKYRDAPNANALRWDTLYNFRFDVDLPPANGQVALGLFRPGTPDTLWATTIVPQLCNHNGQCDVGEDLCNCLQDCTPPPVEQACADDLDDDCDGDVDCYDLDCCDGGFCGSFDPDGDAFGICDDCREDDPSVWATPGRVQNLVWMETSGQFRMTWDAPLGPGGSTVTYEITRSVDAADFMTDAICLIGENPEARYYEDIELPESGTCFNYLVRAKNGCPGNLGAGAVGTNSEGHPRLAVNCP